MSDQLTHKLKEVACSDGKPATIVQLDGSVDPATIDDFDAIFDGLLTSGIKRVIIDMEKLKYINSTGMGIMVQYCDQLADEGGGMVLLSVQPKITLVLEMLGLQELFPIVTTEGKALAALMGEPVESGGAVAPTLVDHLAASTETTIIKCDCCQANLTVGASGDYVCPRCRSLLKVDATGRATTTSSGGDYLEISVPIDAAYFKSVAALVARLGLRAGIPDTAARAVADAFLVGITALSAASSKKNRQLNLLARAETGVLLVRLFLPGESSVNNLGFVGCKPTFDHVECETVNGGCLLTLRKNT